MTSARCAPRRAWPVCRTRRLWFRHDLSRRDQHPGPAAVAAARRQAREIRAALPPDYRNEFDRGYQEALNEAGRTLNLEGIYDTLEHWRMRSWITRDKQEHRRIVQRAVELLTGQEPPTDEPVAVTEARL